MPQLAALLLIGALLLCAAGGAAGQAVKSVFAGADPSILAAEGRVWIYPTGTGDRLAAWSSVEMTTWRESGDLLKLADIPWVKSDKAKRHYLWAPDMVAAHGRYLLYYSVGPQNPTPSRIGVAVCDGPAGPCIDSGAAILTGGDGFEAIDPMVFVDPKTRTSYLYAGGSAGSTLRVYELAPDMLSVAKPITIAQPPHFTEGAFMHERRGVYYLSYSHGRWNDASYSVHYATALSPTGPWTYRGILLASDKRFKGPGHHSLLTDARGRTWIAYHRWEGKRTHTRYTGRRRVAIQRVRYDDAGLLEPVRMSN